MVTPVGSFVMPVFATGSLIERRDSMVMLCVTVSEADPIIKATHPRHGLRGRGPGQPPLAIYDSTDPGREPAKKRMPIRPQQVAATTVRGCARPTCAQTIFSKRTGRR
jgi:hypothetical protein